MGIFNFMKKKRANTGITQMGLNNNENFIHELDDKSFLKEVKHFSDGTWHQYDILLDARPYGWDYMIDAAEYMNQKELENIGTVTISEVMGSQTLELLGEYHSAQNRIKNMPSLSDEQGVLAIGGMSPHLQGPVKIVWINQTNVLRIFAINPDENLVKRYAETLIRRTFGTVDEMKLGRSCDESKENRLYLNRFCGIEQYPVKTASWQMTEGDGTEDDPDMLCLEMTFGAGNHLHEDTSVLEAEPAWEINFYTAEPLVNLLRPGLVLEQPNEEEDVDGNLYYVEHQPTTENKMEIIEEEGKRLKIRLTAVTEDVNYYDGSKPKSSMELVAWFQNKR